MLGCSGAEGPRRGVRARDGMWMMYVVCGGDAPMILPMHRRGAVGDVSSGAFSSGPRRGHEPLSNLCGAIFFLHPNCYSCVNP